MQASFFCKIMICHPVWHHGSQAFVIGTLHGAVRVFFTFLPLCNWCLPEQDSGERSRFARSSLTRLFCSAARSARIFVSRAVRAAAARGH